MWQQILFSTEENKLISALFLLIISWLIYKFLKTPKNLPPGPWGLPILGYVLFLGKKPHIKVANMEKKYGDVIRINVGFTNVIFLTSFKSIKEALVKQADVFSARPEIFVSPPFKKTPGIIGSSGEIWTDFRRFSLAILRELGFGKSTLEPQIQDEISCFVNKVKSFNGEPADLSKALWLSITNIICVVISGQRFDYDNPTINELMHLTEEHVRLLKLGDLKDFLPYALQKPWFFNLFGLKSQIQTNFKLRQLLAQLVEQYANNHQPGSSDNFINSWLSESEKVGSKSTNFTKLQLPGVLMDLFLAGSDTITTTLLWSVLFMIKYPAVQTKVQEEIDEVIGKERTPTMSDQKSMPYTEATLMEISRRATIVPLSLLHGTTKDTTLHGYFIPEGSNIFTNLWAVHHDPEIFAEPFDFNPDRFLTDNQQVKRMEELIPFSMGKRQCIGESLARMELFLYFTTMLQNFVFKAVDGVEIDFDYDYAVVSRPKIRKIRAIIR